MKRRVNKENGSLSEREKERGNKSETETEDCSPTRAPQKNVPRRKKHVRKVGSHQSKNLPKKKQRHDRREGAEGTPIRGGTNINT